jgi:hypothetical protein
MVQLKWLLVLVWILTAVQPGFADDRAKIAGSWKIVSWEGEFQATGEREAVMGKNPTGYVIFTPEGRFMCVLTGEGRTAAKTDEDRAALLKSVVAYTGMYRLEGDKFIVKVDASWNPAWVGTDQERTFKIDGDRLQTFSPWVQSVTRPEKGMARSFIVFERAK